MERISGKFDSSFNNLLRMEKWDETVDGLLCYMFCESSMSLCVLYFMAEIIM